MAELKPSESHCQPALDVRGQEHDGPILDYEFKVGVQELQHQIQVCLGRKYIE